MTVARSNSNYDAHKRWRSKNQLRGLTADGKVRRPARVRMSPEHRRAANTLRMRVRRELNIRLGLKWNGQRRAQRLLVAILCERLALAIARAMVFLPPASQAEFTRLGRALSALRRKHGHRRIVVNETSSGAAQLK